jgi:alpha-D-ribose 1-methylphosphonate 5-triphosphate synthase subunit PhnI
MPYVAGKGGEQAIYNAEALIKAKQRGDRAVP